MSRAAHLFMVRPSLHGVPPPLLPENFSLRSCRAGDEAAWLDIIRRGYGGDWPDDAFQRHMLSEESFRPERLFFAVTETGRPVATAGALRKLPHGDRTGYLHMLAVLPEFRRCGLGTALLRRCLICFREQGWRDAVLDTEVSRPEAIRLYLAAGFVPAPEIEEDVTAWRAVLTAMGRSALAEKQSVGCGGMHANMTPARKPPPRS
ncbi:MAG: GNAT family N-acetyltransferase [Candidatus Brocadiia bacterium]